MENHIWIRELECLEGGEDQLDVKLELHVGRDGGGGDVREGRDLFMGRMVVDIYVYGDLFA